MFKRCTKCGIQKDTKEFNRDKYKRDGLACWCNACRKDYYKEHKEQRKKYLEDHKDSILKGRKKYNDKHREQQKSYYVEHKEEIVAVKAKYRKTENGKAASKRSRHNYRSRTKDTDISLTSEQWAYILKKQRNRCNVCGKRFNAKRPATQDHIIPVMHNGNYSSDNIQALCASCNSSKKSKLDKCYIQTWNILIYTVLSIFV